MNIDEQQVDELLKELKSSYPQLQDSDLYKTVSQIIGSNDPDEIAKELARMFPEADLQHSHLDLFSDTSEDIDDDTGDDADQEDDDEDDTTSSGVKYQSPLKVNWVNLGNFSPGVATDKRHLGGHDGIDMEAPAGTPIYPLAVGTVKKVGNTPKAGNSVTIEHDEGVKSFYAHCNSILVNVGDKVNLNTQIATVGNTGNAKDTSPHLHFQVWVNSQLTNPSNFFKVVPYVSKKEGTNKFPLSYTINQIVKMASFYLKQASGK